MQLVDLTTLKAICYDIQANYIPAKIEQIYQCDRHTIKIALRTLSSKAWLNISWHPQAARICISSPPPKTPDTFTFSDQLRHQLIGLALTELKAIAPWERVIDLQFSKRPQDPPLWHLYIEIMGKYSNVILTNAQNEIVTVAHQVNQTQSRLRPILTGQPYELPPNLTTPIPTKTEPQSNWIERLTLIPGKLKNNLINNYRGLSSTLVNALIIQANLDPDITTEQINPIQWDQLYQLYLQWLDYIENPVKTIDIGLTPSGGYNILGWQIVKPYTNLQQLIDDYYTHQVNQQEFNNLRHQLIQKLNTHLIKLKQKEQTFLNRIQESAIADQYKYQADLLMTHIHQWTPGLTSISLPDWESGISVKISLSPDKNLIQNAQKLYKQHQKLKRAQIAIAPLLAELQPEIQYIEQIQTSLEQIETYQHPEDLTTLIEIKEELISQKYLEPSSHQPHLKTTNKKEPDNSTPIRYQTPNGYEILIGRNNRQNDHLTFKIAVEYDLWFHTQEIPGSHLLLRLPPGTTPSDSDLQLAADLAAYYSRARQSQQVPVVYTKPKQLYKPKGAKPGIVIYKQEKIIWGRPQTIAQSSKL